MKQKEIIQDTQKYPIAEWVPAYFVEDLEQYKDMHKDIQQAFNLGLTESKERFVFYWFELDDGESFPVAVESVSFYDLHEKTGLQKLLSVCERTKLLPGTEKIAKALVALSDNVFQDFFGDCIIEIIKYSLAEKEQ